MPVVLLCNISVFLIKYNDFVSYNTIISPHGIAVPRAYILPLWFFLLSYMCFSTPNLFGH